jgi:hypothetical protein
MTKEERIQEFAGLWADYAPSESDYLVTENNKFMKYLDEGGFFTSPASTKYHGAYEGGLYDHSKTVFKRLAKLTEDNGLIWERPESPFIIGMFHDLCKCDQYVITYRGALHTINDNGDDIIARPPETTIEYKANTILKGHATKSIMILSQFIALTEEEVLCIRFHMGAYETDDWDSFDKAIHKYPNVLYTHMADMLASKVDDI